MPESQLQVPTESEIEKGKTMAIVSWLSGFAGLPLWIIPMVQRDNAYALYHAKHAGMTYLAQIGIAVIFIIFTSITCGFGGFLFPVVFITLVPTIDGLIKAINGRADPPLIIGGMTDMLFGGLTADENKRQIE